MSSTKRSTKTSATTLQDPLTWSHNRVEGSTEYTQLLFVPKKRVPRLVEPGQQAGHQVVCQACLHHWRGGDLDAQLPALRATVSSTAPTCHLNVSRELLQESRDVRAIREGNTRRVLTMLHDCEEFCAESGRSRQR